MDQLRRVCYRSWKPHNVLNDPYHRPCSHRPARRRCPRGPGHVYPEGGIKPPARTLTRISISAAFGGRPHGPATPFVRTGAIGGGGGGVPHRPGGMDAPESSARVAMTQNNLGTALLRLGETGAGGRRLPRGPGKTDARSGSAPLGDDAEQSRHCTLAARRAEERHGGTGGGSPPPITPRWRNIRASGFR
jgi:hypothetical protein